MHSKEDLLCSINFWNALANQADEDGAWEVARGYSTGKVYAAKAETYRRTCASLWMELETGTPHCVCCLKPRKEASKARGDCHA